MCDGFILQGFKSSRLVIERKDYTRVCIYRKVGKLRRPFTPIRTLFAHHSHSHRIVFTAIRTLFAHYSQGRTRVRRVAHYSHTVRTVAHYSHGRTLFAHYSHNRTVAHYSHGRTLFAHYSHGRTLYSHTVRAVHSHTICAIVTQNSHPVRTSSHPGHT